MPDLSGLILLRIGVAQPSANFADLVRILDAVLATNSGFALIRCAKGAYCSVNFVFFFHFGDYFPRETDC